MKKIKLKYLVAPVMLVAILTITVISAAFNQNMLFNADAWARVAKDVRIVSVERDTTSNGGSTCANPEYDHDLVIPSSKFSSSSSTIRYKVGIKNNTSYFINVYDITNYDSNSPISYTLDKSTLSSSYGSQLINPNSTAYVYFDVSVKSGSTIDPDNCYSQIIQLSFSPIFARELAYSNSAYTGCSDVQCALDEISDISKGIVPICIRATTAHTETCAYTSGTSNCRRVGYYAGGAKDTTTISYGNIKPLGSSLETGDAFDCDVNGDDVFDAATERFYYVSDYWNMPSTGENTFDSSYAVLIYYSGVVNGEPSYDKTKYYEAAASNLYGPVTAAVQLPLTSDWSNVTLKDSTRQIYNSNNSDTGSGGTYALFDYSNYAARLITYQEIYNGCYEEGNSITSSNGLKLCEFLFERSLFANSSYVNYGPLTETPHKTNSANIYLAYTQGIYIGSTSTSNLYATVKPAIEVPKARIKR